MKAGFDTQDNGCIRFNNVRIPLNNMLMRNSRVTPDGQYTKIGNELIMYASMLCLRAILGTAGTFYMAASTTIAIRYSCVRRQTAIEDGTEAQIIDYKTQQYRLFPALATTYAFHCTSTWYFRDMLLTKAATNDFESITPDELNQVMLKLKPFGNLLVQTSYFLYIYGFRFMHWRLEWKRWHLIMLWSFRNQIGKICIFYSF